MCLHVSFYILHMYIHGHHCCLNSFGLIFLYSCQVSPQDYTLILDDGKHIQFDILIVQLNCKLYPTAKCKYIINKKKYMYKILIYIHIYLIIKFMYTHAIDETLTSFSKRTIKLRSMIPLRPFIFMIRIKVYNAIKKFYFEFQDQG